jgi:predicted amidohydrolase YtcJ
VEQSLSFYTEGVAHQSYNEDRFGRIKVGMVADLVHLDANPLEIDPLEIAKIKVVATYKNGNRH